MSHGHTWFYSLHFGVSYSLLFAFAVCCFVKALLGPRLETWQSCSQAKQRCSCWKRTKSNPCQCWGAFAWSKVDCMQIAKHTKQAITSAFNCFVVFASRLRCQIWRLKTNSHHLVRTVSVFQTQHIRLCIYFLSSNTHSRHSSAHHGAYGQQQVPVQQRRALRSASMEGGNAAALLGVPTHISAPSRLQATLNATDQTLSSPTPLFHHYYCSACKLRAPLSSTRHELPT